MSVGMYAKHRRLLVSLKHPPFRKRDNLEIYRITLRFVTRQSSKHEDGREKCTIRYTPSSVVEVRNKVRSIASRQVRLRVRFARVTP